MPSNLKSQTDILFGQSYYLRFDPKLWKAMQPYPPLGTLYAASLMCDKGYSVALFDAMLAESEAEWDAALEREQPRFAVLYEDNFNYLSKMCLGRMREAAFTMLKAARQRGCITLVCGADATDHAGAYLSAGADYVLLGEGEATLVELIAALVANPQGDMSHIAGIANLHENKLMKTAPRPVMRDPDSLPFPAWELVDVPRYRDVWIERHGTYSMNMVTTRGCPYHCNWCAKPIWGQRYASRSPENVAAEMAWLKQAYHPDHIWFADDIMGLKPGWWEQFAEAVEKHDARIPFKSLCRADLIAKRDSVDALKRAGCQIVWLGAESGSQSILDAMDKGTTIEQIREAAIRLHQAGIQVGFFLQFGYPGETLADIEKTLQLVRDCQPDDIGISVSYPLPGTRFYDSVNSQLGDKQNWDDSADMAMLYAGPFTTAFYRQLHRVVHHEFRAEQNRRRIERRQSVSPRQLAAMIYHRAVLPLARLQLMRLSKVPHQGIAPLAAMMTPDQAAQPSLQETE